MYAVIGGTQTVSLSVLRHVRTAQIDTPYGAPSGQVTLGEIDGRPFAFLPRHGNPHLLAPHRINYRANVWALRELGARSVIAICTTGGIDEAFGPGTIVCPDQIVDYTTGREHTYSDGLDGRPVEHVEFTLPFGDGLRRRLLAAAGDCGVTVVDGGCYGCVNGPRLETAAEIRMLARDGCSLVGQTMMPEAGLAREAGLEYAALCPVVNHAAGVGSSRQGIERSVLRATREATMERVMQVLLAFARDHAAPPAPGEAA
jgi:5'-methylthioadenosine phosphorylase